MTPPAPDDDGFLRTPSDSFFGRRFLLASVSGTMATMTGHDPSRTRNNPCRRHRCTLCCRDTRMTLTEADVAALEATGATGFARLDDNGDLEFVNRDGRCVFLGDDGCRVYEARPEGCRLYPLVLDLRSGMVIRDTLCPHRGEFDLELAHELALRRSVAREEAEALCRLRRAGD